MLILRELLRPGVLWFIRNLHDPDFNPIQVSLKIIKKARNYIHENIFYIGDD